MRGDVGGGRILLARTFSGILAFVTGCYPMAEEREGDMKLALGDIWELAKYGFAAMVACALVFILPYMLFTGAVSFLKESAGTGVDLGWLTYVISAIILYFVISNLAGILNSISRLCTDLARIADGMSFIRKAVLVILFLACILGLNKYPETILFISALLVIPAGFTYDRYKMILKRKASSTHQAGTNDD
jgi:hypothetical protein